MLTLGKVPVPRDMEACSYFTADATGGAVQRSASGVVQMAAGSGILEGMIVKNVAGRAVFSADKMGKVTVGAGTHLYAGLNCFSPGQEHQAHVHADQDKMYLVLTGRGEARVGDELAEVQEGDLILAAAGVIHGLKNTGTEPFSVLVVFGPPPKAK